MTEKRIPMRQCLGCREMKPKTELLRVVRIPDRTVQLDLNGKSAGRGAYFCSVQCLKKSAKSKVLERVLGVPVPQNLYECLQAKLEDNT